jgi:hypothetical protein
MIGGALGGLLIAIAYTLVTGKLQLTKKHIVYGLPARVSALLGLLPFAALILHLLSTKRTGTEPGGLGIFAATLALCVVVIYATGWKYGEQPRT